MALNPDAAKLRATAVRKVKAAVTSALAANPFLPREFIEVPAGTNGNKANWLPPAAARRVFGASRVEVKSPHFSRSGVAIPSRESLRRNIEHRVRRPRCTLANVAVVRRGTKAINVQQCR